MSSSPPLIATMPPKRPLKRRSEDEGRKQTKRTGKNKREQTYDTYDEALDGGVEMEEKGERYRDGDKVRQNFGQDKEAQGLKEYRLRGSTNEL